MRPDPAYAWPRTRFDEAVRQVLLRSKLPLSGESVTTSPDSHGVERWLRDGARGLGSEGIVEEVRLAGAVSRLTEEGPYLVVIPAEPHQDPVAVAFLLGPRRRCTVVRQDGGETEMSAGALDRVLFAMVASDHPLAQLFAEMKNGGETYRRLLHDDVLENRPCLVARFVPDASHPLLRQFMSQRLPWRVFGYLVLAWTEAAMAGVAAWTLGDAAITGVVDPGRIMAWSMLAASVVAVEYVSATVLGGLSLDFSMVMKKRLLEGALSIEDVTLSAQGFAGILARLSEASLLEQTNPAELFRVLSPLAYLAAGMAFLIEGTIPAVTIALASAFLLASAAVVAELHRRYASTYATRLSLTEDLVDKIVGHQTRAIQEDRTFWHDAEDGALWRYAHESRGLDRVLVAAATFCRAWVFAVGLALLLAFVAGAPTRSLVVSAIGAGLVSAGFFGAIATAERVIAWRRGWLGVRPLFVAGGERSSAPPSSAVRSNLEDEQLDTVVSSLSFAYRIGQKPILADVHLRIRPGERLLVEGPSGGGKTTLSKLLTGELRPNGGSILVGGVDSFSVSRSEWRTRVAACPQFHENYLFSNTFGFNVDPRSLDGRMSAEAFDVCRELGLGPLLDKMPAGAAQRIGETGWQLSHGERSRVFVARSLLQGARLLIFDESFAALDPELLATVISCVERRAQTLVVIAHT